MKKTCETCINANGCAIRQPFGCEDYENKYGYPEPDLPDDDDWDDDDDDE